MSDEFMPNGTGTPEQPDMKPRQDYSTPEPDSQPEPDTGSYQPSGQQSGGEFNYGDRNMYGQTDYYQPNSSYQTNTYSGPENAYSGRTNAYGGTSNPYSGQANAGQQPYYGQAAGQKGTSTGFGIASLVLGILSIFTFACCINYLLSLLAIIFGIIQIVKSEKKGFAIGGIITAVISIIIATVMWVGMTMFVAEGMDSTDPDNPFQKYLEEYEQYYNESMDDLETYQ